MASAVSPGVAPLGTSPWDEERRWVLGGLAAMFVLIGVAVVAAVVVPLAFNASYPAWGPGGMGDWLPGLIGLAIAILILVWVIRAVVWTVARPFYGPFPDRWYARPYARARWMGYDPAFEAARERYARGEISSDQYDRIVRDLQRPGPS